MTTLHYNDKHESEENVAYCHDFMISSKNVFNMSYVSIGGSNYQYLNMKSCAKEEIFSVEKDTHAIMRITFLTLNFT